MILGKIEGGSKSYQLVWDDILWAARMLEGEAGSQAASIHGEAILWTMASRFIVSNFKTYRGLICAYSQPINQRWKRDGDKCEVGGPFHGTERCSPEALDRRDYLSNKPWEEFSPSVQTTVLNWATARTPNPVPRAVHFAQLAITEQGIAKGVGWEPVWKSKPSRDSNPRAVNQFLSTVASRKWEDNFVKIVCEGREAA